MFTNEEFQELILLPKQILENNPSIDLGKIKNRLTLFSNESPEFEFLLEVTSNKRIAFKINLHHQEDVSKVGLIRIDYNGSRHKNPEETNEYLPSTFRKYAGKWILDSHIHQYIESYPPLVWAIPLKDHSFPIKEVTSSKDFGDAVRAISEEINIIDKFLIQDSLV